MQKKSALLQCSGINYSIDTKIHGYLDWICLTHNLNAFFLLLLFLLNIFKVYVFLYSHSAITANLLVAMSCHAV